MDSLLDRFYQFWLLVYNGKLDKNPASLIESPCCFAKKLSQELSLEKVKRLLAALDKGIGCR